MLPRPDAPVSKLAKKKAELDQTIANQALRFGITNPPVIKKDKPWYEDVAGAIGGAIKSVYENTPSSMPSTTPLNMYGGADGVSMGSQGTAKSLFIEPARLAVRRAVGDITAIPRVGKPSPSYTADQIRQQGVARGVLGAAIDYSQFIPVVAKGAGFASDAVNAYKLAAMERQANPFPALRGASNVIDVVPGSRLPARVVESPAPPATRLAEAQSQRALPPAATRALPPAFNANAAEQLAIAQARQQTHFGTVSKEPIDVIQSTEFPRLSPKYVDEGGIPDLTAEIKQAVSFPVYEIGGQKIAFGNPDLGRFAPEFNTQDVQFVPLDPYQITGLPKTSVEGQNFATTMFDAHQGMQFESPGAKNIGQVSALTYAASRGDNIAMQELQRLADVGKQGMNAQRLTESERILSFHKDWSNPNFWDNKPTVQVKLGTAKDGYTEIKRPMGIDDMFLVHQTDYAPTFDANGNIILKPTGDYAPIDTATGKPQIDKISGKPVANYDRDNVHFTINHLVEGHMYRNTPTGESYTIVVPLRNVLDANPGSLDNLYAIDTFLTPKPGEGLVIPMQNGRVVQGAGAEVSNNVFQALQEVGKLHNQLPEYQTRKILGGSHYANTEYIDDRIKQIALQELEKEYPEYVGGVSGITHSNHPSYHAQRFDNFDLQGGRGWLTGQDYWRMSPNQKLRIYDSNSNKYTTGELKTTYEPDYFGL